MCFSMSNSGHIKSINNPVSTSVDPSSVSSLSLDSKPEVLSPSRSERPVVMFYPLFFVHPNEWQVDESNSQCSSLYQTLSFNKEC